MIDIVEKYTEMAQTDPAKAYKGLAKVADQRLVSLERASQREGTKSATNYAYKWAIREMKGLYGEGVTRFNKTVKQSELMDSRGKLIDINRVYQARINAMLTFVNLQTSTIGGLRQTFRNRADVLNERYGDLLGFEFTEDNIGDFFESKAFEQGNDRWGSSTVFQTIGAFKEKEKDFAERIAEYGRTHNQDYTGFDIGEELDDPLQRAFLNELVRSGEVRSLDDLYKGFGLNE